MPDPFRHKLIADPVHGTIGLSELEVDVIQTPAFQRLRNVKNLGLAHYVYPGADFSRFSHSIGVCHVTGKILQAIKDNMGEDANIDYRVIQEYRLAGLLHDIGHYPFSHAAEHALERCFPASTEPVAGGMPVVEGTAPIVASQEEFLDHESVGGLILNSDPNLKPLVTSAGYDPKKIADIFNHDDVTGQFVNLVSSDLDADRIDYILRTAVHTGLPYGNLDLDYMLTQIRLDEEQRICLTSKALRAADHFLLCRYFDNQQVAFHKTVAGLEVMLQDCIIGLLQEKAIDWSPNKVRGLVSKGEWTEDDVSFENTMRLAAEHLAKERVCPELHAKLRSVLMRQPPVIIADIEELADRDRTREFKNYKGQIEREIPGLSEQFNIPNAYFRVWAKKYAWTKTGAKLSLDATPAETEREIGEAVRILLGGETVSKPIMQIDNALMKVISEKRLISIRLYVLLPDGANREDLRSQLRVKIRQSLPDLPWR